MSIIDAQVHLWRKGTPTPPHLATPYLVEDAIRGMDEAGVDGAILHPPASWDPDSNEQAVEAVLAYPKRFAILGYPPVDKPESPLADRDLETAAGHAGLAALFQQAAQPVLAHGRHAWTGSGRPPRKRNCRWPCSRATGCRCLARSRPAIRV